MGTERLYEIRSELPVSEALARIADVGCASARKTLHRELVAVEVVASPDPFAPRLEVEVETRPVGCYVTARIVPSALLRDFARVVRVALTLYAFGVTVFVCVHVQGPALVRAVCGIGAGWAALIGLFGAAEHALERHAERQLLVGRLRHQLSRALYR